MKIIAFIAAILSAATVATLTFTTVPSIQKQAVDNAAAIETLDNELENLQGTFDVFNAKKTYTHNILITSSNLYVTTIINNQSNETIDNANKFLNAINASTTTQTLSASGAYVGTQVFYSIYAIRYVPGTPSTFVALGYGTGGSNSWNILSAVFNDTILRNE